MPALSPCQHTLCNVGPSSMANLLVEDQHANLAKTVHPNLTCFLGLHPPLQSWPEPIQGAATGLAVCKIPYSSQHHSKGTSALERKKGNTTHQSGGVPRSGLEADNWSDCRLCPPMKASHETTQGKHPGIWCYCISGRFLV